MDTSSAKLPDRNARFVIPRLRPSSEQPSRRRLYASITVLALGFVAIFFGGAGLIGQLLLVVGFVLIVAGLYTLRAWGFGPRRQRTDTDIRKLYGSNKAEPIDETNVPIAKGLQQGCRSPMSERPTS